MSITSRVIEVKAEKGKGFPKLMKSLVDGRIVLFKNKLEGTVVLMGKSKGYSIGTYVTDWIPEAFTDFNDQLILQNEDD